MARWHVLRDHDAFPGEDLGKVPVSQLAQAKVDDSDVTRLLGE